MQDKKLKMYIEYRGEKPYSYLFGEEWVAMQLFVEGSRYRTPQDAFDAYKKEHPDFDGVLEDYWNGRQ